ncbi:MAG: DEAD/DEAH box helicase family protein, partial [Myxococcaceae bacterium]
MELHFEAGTLIAPQVAPDAALRRLFVEDTRTGVFRAPAHHYRAVIERLRELGAPYKDHARAYEPLPLQLTRAIEPFPHQKQALDAWIAKGCRGVVELPTGAGKTLLAVLAIAHAKRPTLVVVPTLDLMQQWHTVLTQHLSCEVGQFGGGIKDSKPLTVTTYDSATLRAEFQGHRYGLLVCDECHHLPAPSYRFIAEAAIAPLRLGLTATLGESDCRELLGPLIHRTEIQALQGEYLAPYEVRRIEVRLDAEEQTRHDAARQRYLAFIRSQGISFSGPGGFGQFIARSQRTEEGRAAYQAYREQRRIALTCRAKVEALWNVLRNHRGERLLVFTEDNETVYTLAHKFFVPALTHHTPLPERRALL